MRGCEGGWASTATRSCHLMLHCISYRIVSPLVSRRPAHRQKPTARAQVASEQLVVAWRCCRVGDPALGRSGDTVG